MRHVHIHVTGIVQGVGMRPFVYREAMAHGICGWVLNAGDGVHIEAHARAEAVDGFVAALSEHAPAAARVERVDIADLKPSGWSAADEQGFRIVASQDQTAHTTLVSPDIATCDDCLRELFDPADRRYHYPFINCTNCGPRFTIIRSLPYDRAATSMNCFPMCPECAAEYADPLDRRFHAQPDACFDCGPHITWREASVGGEPGEAAALPAVGTTREASDAIIERCIELLAGGGIVAIKGLGGFHLACDASNEQAVAELRRRKRRSNKPLAVMVRDLADVERLCHVNDVERGLLAGSIRPIVLLRRRAVCESGGSPDALALAPSVAHDLPELGVMLPYTPLQHLLLAAAEARGVHALVMTSGNLSEEPIETDDDLAWERLVAAGIADALLGNDRAILSRYDDSVVRVVNGAIMPVRRARGYAPQPLPLPALDGAPSCVLACGPQQKATIALTREGTNGEATCFVSQHIGDVENGGTFDAWNAARTRLEDLFDLAPAALACDLHPSYLSDQWAREQARKCNLPLVEVQHHHAHIASVMAEAIAAGQLTTDTRVLGIAFDGTGAGTDGTIWGGEFLVASLDGFERTAHLLTWALPGGAASVRDARRNAFALLSELGLLEHPGAAQLLDSLDEQTRSVTATMIERGINSPRTSSMGRLFDAAAAILGICDKATYEGEPAIELEAAAWRAFSSESACPTGNMVSFSVTESSRPDDCHVLNSRPLFEALLEGIRTGVPAGKLALDFHVTIARSSARIAREICAREGLDTVALSGGVFMNRLLLQLLTRELKSMGLTVLIPRSVPVNDGCIAYGQAVIARARLAQTASR
ncbi:MULTISPECIES: carbamoyltransferase HypF [Collinsella]|mgnify:CR=1 FL=1|jgi:[NiFe] hydrogenase maturation protein HypF|uniref:carbamoyltransferase HypF n=1 Tax=Collinsella TaxID=102106 RepID=UPI000F5F6A67|nr:carbamoyltransferase HypF [Collinsella aerofaciens]MBS6159542.1 carbamoyltransferase HypF [Collinsella sp.]AZH68844.1 carbamoyltransferase HypF [Collinsella aerofaciens]MED9986020.1 carbamoyltransferase HypF [Collinsella sp.]MZJ61516.1 carbamoyltransferase HypF [Collinsella aerofaciens]MZJ70576.1 carbamoyltransferase HypF [Collinsella aerofaciens]